MNEKLNFKLNVIKVWLKNCFNWLEYCLSYLFGKFEFMNIFVFLS